jgi:peptide deformylase
MSEDLQKFIDSPSGVVIYDPTKDSILTKEAKEVDDLNHWEKIIPIMFDIMHKHNGCGLAAPQVGLSYRVFILNVTKPMVFINPIIIDYGKDLKEEIEGCLSIPGKNYKILRPIKIKVKWTRLDGEQQIQQYEGWTARAFQHEYDHLLGRLICHRSSYPPEPGKFSI